MDPTSGVVVRRVASWFDASERGAGLVGGGKGVANAGRRNAGQGPTPGAPPAANSRPLATPAEQASMKPVAEPLRSAFPPERPAHPVAKSPAGRRRATLA